MLPAYVWCLSMSPKGSCCADTDLVETLRGAEEGAWVIETLNWEGMNITLAGTLLAVESKLL